MAKQVTTLFIRDTGINVLVMKGRQVAKWARSPLEPGLVSQGLILDEDTVAEKVKELFSREKLNTKKVIAGLSGFDSLYRVVTLPDLPEAIIPEAVRREAQRTIPTSLDEVYFSYQALPGTAEKRFFLATYPRNTTDALVRTLRKAGIAPYVMDLAPLALSRIPDEPRAVIVNARSDHLDIMVIADRIPQVIRTLSLPGESDSLEDNIPIIAEEFSRTVTFYNSGHLEYQLDDSVPVYVCGDLAAAPESWETLVGASGQPVSPLPSPVPAPEGFDPIEFMVNIGLGLKELLLEKGEAHFSIVNFNALPAVHVPPSFSILRVLVPVGVVIGVAALVFLGISVLTNRAQIETLRTDVARAEGLVVQEQSDIAALRAEVTSTEDTANTLRDTIVALDQGRADMYLDLRDIDRAARRHNVQWESIRHVGESVTVGGRAGVPCYVYNYSRYFRDDSDRPFLSVWVSPVECRRPDGCQFTLIISK